MRLNKAFFGTDEKATTQTKAKYLLESGKIVVNSFIPHQNQSERNAGDLNERERGQIVGVGC